MRVAVIGASNSLMREGYVAGMSDAGVDLVVNGSLGHSQAVILPFRLNTAPFTETPFDHLIIEVATNEQVALRSSLANFRTIEAVLDWSVRWCAERGIGVSLVVMPELASYSHARDLRAFGLRHFMADYARRNSLLAADGYNWVEDWASTHDISPEECFEAPAHLHAEIARAFGVSIAERLSSAPAPAPAKHGYSARFAYVPVAHAGQGDVIERATSIERAQLLRLAASDTTIDLPRGYLVGVVHNSAGSTGVMQIEGTPTRRREQTSLAKRLDANPGEKLVLTAWGFRNPVRVNGATAVRSLPVAYAPDLEHNHVTVWRPPRGRAVKHPALELAGFVVAR